MTDRLSTYLFLTLLLGGILAGCLGSKVVVEIPNARIGDQVVFEVTLTSTAQKSVRQVSFTLLDVVELNLPDGQRRTAVRLHEEGVEVWRADSGAPWNYTKWLYVDLDSMRVIKTTDQCAGSSASTTCSPVVHYYGSRGSGWGFGSGLLQGLSIRGDAPSHLEERIDGEAVGVEVQVVSRSPRTGTATLAMAPSEWDAPAARAEASAHRGTVVVREGNPYVIEADLQTMWRSATGVGVDEARLEARQLAYVPGDGIELHRLGAAPVWNQCHEAVPWEGALPAGAGATLPGLNVSLKEFTDHLEGSDAGFREHIRTKDALLELVSVRPAGAVEGPLGLTAEEWYASNVAFPAREGEARMLLLLKHVETQLLPPGQRERVWVDREESRPTMLPLIYQRQPLADLEQVIARHGTAGPEGSEYPVFVVEFLQEWWPSHEGALAFIQPRLDIWHAAPPYPGQPQRFAVFKYALQTGCLVEHQPGLRHWMSEA